MKLEDQVCSLELAKKLKELGVKQESEFYWADRNSGGLTLWREGDVTSWGYEESFENQPNDIAAFTVAELGEMLPLWYYSKRIPDGSWSTDHVSRMDILNTNEKTEADSRAAMLIQLIERKIERL